MFLRMQKQDFQGDILSTQINYAISQQNIYHHSAKGFIFHPKQLPILINFASYIWDHIHLYPGLWWVNEIGSIVGLTYGVILMTVV